MIDAADEIGEIERLAQSCGVEMKTVLAHAGIAVSTWWRWKENKFEPAARSMRKLRTAIREISAESAV